MPCLICRYFQPAEPQEHKQQRETNQCESHCGREWDQFTAIRYVRNHGGMLDGWCRLYPEAKRVAHNHVCGQISVRDYYFNSSWGVERMDPDDNLFEWASGALTTVLDGGSFSRQRLEHLEGQNRELRRQLKRAREVSASRLKRLQKSDDEPEAKPEPAPLRLVAAE